MAKWKRFFFVLALIYFGAIALSPASAKITRLQIKSIAPFGSFRAGDYLRLEGRITGELASASEAIPDLEKAARNARGMIEYSGRITIIMPADPTKGNGALLVDIPNRGRPVAHFLYNSAHDRPLLLQHEIDHGIGFLEDQGYIVAIPSWELGHGTELPTFTDSDGKVRYVEGVGFAIIRDTADFLSTATADSVGEPNPIAGAVRRTLAIGYSQTARLLKTALVNGFNVNEGHTVFRGMHLFGAAAGQAILRSTMGPTSSADQYPSFEHPNVRGVNEEPLAMHDVIERVNARNEIPPRMLVVNASGDYTKLRASLARTGANGIEDLPIPDNMRIYDIAGTSHGVVREEECKLPVAFLDWHPILRATLVALDQWVENNIEPPESRLMPLEQAEDKVILPAPAHLPGAVIQVPIKDEDGNPIGGVRLPDIAAPLGSQGGDHNSFLGSVCSLVGITCSGKKDQARTRCHESISRRYHDRNGYINTVRIAARELVNARLLLPEDLTIIVHSAAQAPGP